MDPMAAEGLTRRNEYRRWFKAVVEQLEEVGFYNIERDIKLENLEEIDEETWVRYYSVPDRRYIYTAGEGNGCLELYGGSSIALNSLEGLRARIDLKQVITCTTISRNLLSLVQLAANGWDVSLGRDSSSTTTRGNTYPIKIVDNFFCVEVAPPLDFDMTIDTTFHQSPAAAYAIHALEGLRLLHPRLAHFNETKIKASIAAGAKFGEHKTSARHRHQETHAPLSRLR
ncbi:hypothetical protein RI054_16g75820 [Pseudoscourfieldia marina]